MRARLEQVAGPGVGGSAPIRSMDHHDIKIGQVDAAIGSPQNRIVPFPDLTQEDARERFRRKGNFVVMPGRLTMGTTAPTTDGKNKYWLSSPGASSRIASGLSEAAKSTLPECSLRMPASEPIAS